MAAVLPTETADGMVAQAWGILDSVLQQDKESRWTDVAQVKVEQAHAALLEARAELQTILNTTS